MKADLTVLRGKTWPSENLMCHSKVHSAFKGYETGKYIWMY